MITTPGPTRQAVPPTTYEVVRRHEAFFTYYNHEHRHSGIGLHTPASVHFGTAAEIRAQRQATLDAAHATHPHRFGNRRPQAPKLPQAAWINQPSPEALIQTA